MDGHGKGQIMTYELIAICDGCRERVTFRVDALGKKFADRPLPDRWTHVHRRGQPGLVTPEIGIACLHACLPKARQIPLARRARGGKRRPRKEPMAS